jgi:hypothetical protein
MPPTLTTDRLILRAHTAADFPGCYTLWSDPDVTRFIGGRPSTPEEVWSRILRYIGHWQVFDYGYFVITDRPTGTIIGEVGLADFHRDCTPPIDAPEAGWVLLPQYQGPRPRPRSAHRSARLGRPIHAPHRLHDRPGQRPLAAPRHRAGLHRIRPPDL